MERQGRKLEIAGAASASGLESVADGFASIADAEKYLAVSRSKLYGMMDAKLLTYAKFGKSRRIPWQALREFAVRSLVG